MAQDNKVGVEVAVSVTGQEALSGLSPALDKVGQQAVQLQAQGQAAGAGLNAVANAASAAGQASGQAATGIAQTGNAAGRAASAEEQSASALHKMGESAQAASGKLGETRQGLQSISTQLDALQGKLTSTAKELAVSMGGMFAAARLKDFALDTIALADAYGQMAERIKMATPAASEYDMVQQRIFESANLTYRPLKEQQELYIRTAEALRALGYNTSQALDITDSFSYLLTTNAASAERAQNAIDAYTKSIQSGRVDAQSWQSILAAMPTVVDAIATATGKTAQQIRQMGITGNLALRDLDEGLRQSVEANKAAAAGMSATVNDAMTRLANTWQKYVGEANQANGATTKIIKLIDLLSENLNTVVEVATKVGEVLLAALGVKALTALAQYSAQLALAANQTVMLGAATEATTKQVGRLGQAMGAIGAAIAGWEIGTWLSEKFETVRQAGIYMVEGLVKGFTLVQNAWELVKATFSDQTYEQALEKNRQRLDEVNQTFAQMHKDATDAARAQLAAAQATAATAAAIDKVGSAAGGAAQQLADLQKGYEVSSAALQQQVALLEKTAAARNAEAQTEVQLAQALGNEVQQRQAAANAAEVQAQQLQRMATARHNELSLMLGQREAMKALDEAYRAAHPEVQEQLRDLDQSIALRRAETEVAEEQARQSGIVAAQARAQAEAVQDNSARVDELRVAQERATEAYLRATRAYMQGKATIEEVNRAEQERIRTALVYRDALQDQRQAIDAKNRAEQAGFDVQQQGIRVSLEQQKAILDVCKARGDEEGVMIAQNNIRRLEIELLHLQAEAKRAEANAQLAAVEAKRAELQASGQLTEQQKLELEAATKAAEVKKMEADIADISARKLRDLALAEEEAGNAADKASYGHEKNAEAIDKETDAALRQQGITRTKGASGQDVYMKGGRRVTQDGWAADSSGNRVVMNNDLGSLTGIYNFLKSAGVDDDEAARRIAREFADENGSVPWWGNPGQHKYRKTIYDSLSTAVLNAAEQYTFGLDKGNPVTHNFTKPATSPTSFAATSPSTPSGTGASAPSGASRTVNVNLSLQGRGYGAVRTDEAGADNIEAFMRALENDKRIGGRY